MTNMGESKTHTVESRPGHHVVAVLLALCAFALGYVMLELDAFTTGVSSSVASNTRGRNSQCGSVCEIRRTHRLEHFDGRDLLNRRDLQKQLQDAKERLVAKLKADYGEYFDKMFVSDKDGSYIPLMPYGNQSMPLLKRKLMIKVLQTQKELLNIEKNVNHCDCTAPEDEFSSQRRLQINDQSADAALIESTFSKYVWATGGHSAAAGHGNLYNESYTAYMERDLKDIFGSIGIDFEARNYAMGGTGSAAEIAMCWEQVYGRDVDFFSWDFGMLDTGKDWRLFHYAYRGSLSPGRPAFYAMWSFKRIRHKLDELTNLGLPSFYADESIERARRDQIPETTTLKGKEIEALPPYMKYFKCGGALEKNDCDLEHKYSQPCFEQRMGKAGWHPGYKLHGLWGHSMALFVMQALISAVDDLVSLESESLGALLARLESEENKHYEELIKKDPFTEEGRKKFDRGVGYNLEGLPNVDPELDLLSLFLKGKSICHTVRLPSRIRYLGYLTDSKNTGGPSVFGQETYDIGVELQEAKANKTFGNPNSLQLVWEADDGQRRHQCPLVIAPDPKDSYFIKHGDGWRDYVIPNAATRVAYDYDPSAMKGIIVMIFRVCDWGECPKGVVGAKDLADGKKWDIKINDVPVTNLTDIGNLAIVPSHADGVYFPQRSDGGYRLEFRVNEPDHYAQISSIIVF